MKTINDNAPNLLVNENAHNNCKGVTHYWFVKPHLTYDNRPLVSADYWIFSYDEVSDWGIKFCKYTNAYYKNI